MRVGYNVFPFGQAPTLALPRGEGTYASEVRFVTLAPCGHYYPVKANYHLTSMNREVFTPHFPICIYNYRYESIVKNVSEAMLSSTDAGGLQCFPLRASPHPSPPPRRGNMRLDSSLCNPRPLWEREQLCLSCAKTTNAGEGMNPLEKKHIYIHPHQGSA